MGGRVLRLGWVRGLSSAAIPCFKENIVNYLGKCTSGKLPLFIHGEVFPWEDVILEIVHLGSYHLGNCTFEKLLLGKIPLGS